MGTAFHTADWHVYAALGAVLVLGLARMLRRLWRTSGDYMFANEFRDNFISYCNSQGEYHARFDWLMRHSNRMQTDMGTYGIYGSYKPPFANYAYTNYPIILNMLPELRSYIEREFGGTLHGETIAGFMRAIDEANRPPADPTTSPRLPPWAHRTLPRAPPRQPIERHAAARAGPSRGLRGQASSTEWPNLMPPHGPFLLRR